MTTKQRVTERLCAALEHPRLSPIGSDPIKLRSRLVGMGYGVACGRCGGCGRYSFNQFDGDRCYGCNGRGVVPPKLTARLRDTVIADVDGGALDAYADEVHFRARMRREASGVVSALEGLEAASAWRAHHYPKGPDGRPIRLRLEDHYDCVSYALHRHYDAVIAAASAIASKMRWRNVTQPERDAAAQELATRRSEFEWRLAVLDAAFVRLRDSGELDKSRREGNALKEANASYAELEEHRRAASERAREVASAAVGTLGLTLLPLGA